MPPMPATANASFLFLASLPIAFGVLLIVSSWASITRRAVVRWALCAAVVPICASLVWGFLLTA
jgi:hypothetical protein